MFIYSFFYIHMKNKLPKLVKELLKKYKVYYECCDICNIKCCNGVTTFTIDGVQYVIDKSGVSPQLVLKNTPAPAPRPKGLELYWTDYTLSPYTTFTDLNNAINGSNGMANFTGVTVIPEENLQIFTGGTNVNAGNSFIRGLSKIVKVIDTNSTIIAQKESCQYTCDNLTEVTLPALVSQTNGNQSFNPKLVTINLNLLASQTGENQRNNLVLTTLTLPALTMQGGDNQINCAALKNIDLFALTSIGTGNFAGTPPVGLTIRVKAALNSAPDIVAAVGDGATIVNV